MENDKLIVFRFSRGIIIGVLSFIIVIIVFFLFAICTAYLKPTNSFLIGVAFFSTMFGTSYLLNIWFSKYIYNEVGFIQTDDNQIFVKFDRFDRRYSKKSIDSISFEYKGDDLWKAKYPIFQKYKSYSRYLTSRKFYSYEKTLFDKISINKEEYFVKIRNAKDKKIFYSIVDWVKEKEINNNL
jgi:hypothetical protein